MPPLGGQPGSPSAGPALWATTVQRELPSLFPALLGPSTTPLVSVTPATGLSCRDGSGDQLSPRSVARCDQCWWSQVSSPNESC